MPSGACQGRTWGCFLVKNEQNRVYAYPPIYLYEGRDKKVHQRNKNASDGLQRTGQVDTSRLARSRYTTLVIFCQETADRLPKGSTEPVATWPSVRRDAIPSYSPGNPGRAKLQMLSISRKCCQPVTKLLPRCEQLLQGKAEIRSATRLAQKRLLWYNSIGIAW
jgi:hypothetical protein